MRISCFVSKRWLVYFHVTLLHTYYQRIHTSLRPSTNFIVLSSLDFDEKLWESLRWKAIFNERFSINDFQHESGSFIDAILWECQRWSTRLRCQIKDTWLGFLLQLLSFTLFTQFLRNMINESLFYILRLDPHPPLTLVSSFYSKLATLVNKKQFFT